MQKKRFAWAKPDRREVWMNSEASAPPAWLALCSDPPQNVPVVILFPSTPRHNAFYETLEIPRFCDVVEHPDATPLF